MNRSAIHEGSARIRFPGTSLRRAIIGATLALSLASCGITADDSPRDLKLTPANDDVTGTDVKTVITATSTSFIYLVASGVDTNDSPLQPVPRDAAETAESVLRVLFAGPTAREENAGLTTSVPAGTALISVSLAGDLATINITEGLSELTGPALLVAVGQIVLTVTDVVGVGSVTIEQAGVPLALRDTSGIVHTEPLERVDFKSLTSDAKPVVTTPPTAP